MNRVENDCQSHVFWKGGERKRGKEKNELTSNQDSWENDVIARKWKSCEDSSREKVKIRNPAISLKFSLKR